MPKQKTPMRERRRRLAVLRRIMRAYGLTSKDVAAHLNRTPSNVRVWLCAAQAIPEDALRILAFSFPVPRPATPATQDQDAPQDTGNETATV